MADYSKLRVGVVYSENSDYSAPKLQTNLDPFTDTTATHYEVQYRSIGTSTETLELGGFTTISYVVIKNKDSTNYITATFRSAGNGSTDNILRCAAGKILVLSDVTAANDLALIANTAACDVEVVVIGV